ncbi:helix-turn-helix transcriptional regulator [Pacificimonas sp. WHA3]|uniref:Helix-turn-helix transcriptional regulator n=1 Tax=Pacificimonas pallii TaxID=2827236 RepID=A0ABS6SDC8_9SPHN|nr:S24 family peptidase [Pacificimonas pallii]MBV7256341.1 helix-turn-helix transcriptional regulator [Pacificimonas pallii]
MKETEIVRRRLDELIRNSGADYTSLSRMLGRNPAYIQQFIKRGVPRKLDESDRRKLALHFNVPESDLGGSRAIAGRAVAAGKARAVDDYMLVPYFTGIGASAGSGALTGEQEAAESALAFQVRWMKAISSSDPELLSVIKVQGDSMLPTLGDGDPILVDRGDGAARLRDGIYVMRADDALIVKRIMRNPAARTIRITSDNAMYPDVGDCDPADVEIIGRVIWVGRQLR